MYCSCTDLLVLLLDTAVDFSVALTPGKMPWLIKVLCQEVCYAFSFCEIGLRKGSFLPCKLWISSLWTITAKIALPRVLPWDTADATGGMRKNLQACVTDPRLCYGAVLWTVQQGALLWARTHSSKWRWFVRGFLSLYDKVVF